MTNLEFQKLLISALISDYKVGGFANITRFVNSIVSEKYRSNSEFFRKKMEKLQPTNDEFVFIFTYKSLTIENITEFCVCFGNIQNSDILFNELKKYA